MQIFLLLVIKEELVEKHESVTLKVNKYNTFRDS